MTISCNAGKAKMYLVGDMNGVGTVWYYKYGIANVLSLGLVTYKFRVRLDIDINNALYVHRTDGTFRRFEGTDTNLYYNDLAEASGTMLTLSTVSNNKEKYSNLDCKRAERAAKL